MSRIKEVEPLVREALIEHPITRDDNFHLYGVVLAHYIDVNMPLVEVFARHTELKIPSLETITRCRRKIQEREPELASQRAMEAREREEIEHEEYAVADKVWY